ncbi:transporter substrate-binding domain-containing protein [Serpentinicella sp. ANB-PHB4]|uniref:transporter substrate-binding domain-containing protein n=1 Tax=Serpentinicella sp. ANB-PHB4 TaxID=3074076 RepID=UPI00286398F9|nr:transporter substrate-binding domain-containing protein [Serpentinicella sp. ANB-PHB4]MDR5658733.1 transporter substrate-binding domain-containing protein [Serpentinicella sp. ANB-PHB4]
MNKLIKKYSVAIIAILTLFLLVGCGGSDPVSRYPDIPTALTELTNGGVDAVVADSPVVLEFIANNPDANIEAFGDESFDKEYFGIAMRQEDEDIHELINQGLAAIKENGVYDKVFNKYFGDGTDYQVEPGENTLDITLNVAMDMAYAPFEYVNDAGEPEGFDVDLIQAIAAEKGFVVNLVNTNWDGIIPALIGGNADIIISAMTITEERKETVTFSDPYFESTQYIAVQAGSEIKTLDDLKGKKVGVQNGTTGDFAISDFFDN